MPGARRSHPLFTILSGHSYRLMHRLLFVAAFGCAVAVQPRAAAAQTDQAAAVRATVVELFDAMRAGDSTRVRSLMHPEARFMSAVVRQGMPGLAMGDVDRFVQAVGTPRDEVWDERIANVVVQVDRPLASAWMDYAFYLGDRFSHCGVNAFQFLQTDAGWKIVQVTDTRRQEGCAPEVRDAG